MEQLNSTETFNDTGLYKETGSLVAAGFMITFSAVALILNGIGLFHFLSKRDSRSAFDWYLITLMLINMVTSLLLGPLESADFLLVNWPWGSRICGMYVYFSWIILTVVPYIHMLISVNRFWAAFFPIHYRTHHTSPRLVVLSIGAVVLFTNAVFLPYFYYTYLEPGWKGSLCDLDSSLVDVYGTVLNYVLYFAPVSLIIVFNPLIALKIRRKLAGIAPTEESSRLPSSAVSGGDKDELKRSRLQHSLYILLFLTLSTLVTFIPLNVMETMAIYNNDAITDWMFEVAITLYFVQPVLDPICFVLILPDVRKRLSTTRPHR